MTELDEEFENQENIFKRVLHNKYEPIESETLVDFVTKSEHLT